MNLKFSIRAPILLLKNIAETEIWYFFLYLYNEE